MLVLRFSNRNLFCYALFILIPSKSTDLRHLLTPRQLLKARTPSSISSNKFLFLARLSYSRPVLAANFSENCYKPSHSMLFLERSKTLRL